MLFVACPAFGGAMQDGNAAYKAKDYPAAIAAYSKAASGETGVEKAKAEYKLGLSYEKTKDFSNALSSYTAAQAADPSLSFAKNPGAFERKLARAQRLAAGGAATAPGQSVENALVTSNVYIDAGLPVQIDKTTLEQVAVENARTQVKIAILAGLPAWYQKFANEHAYDSTSALVHYVEGLHKHLALGRNGLIVVCTSGYGAGIAIQSSELKKDAEARIAQRYVAAIQAGDMGQVVPMAREVVSAINGVHAGAQALILGVVLIVVLIVAIVLIQRARLKSARMTSLRAPVDALRKSVEDNIEYIDGYLPALPKNNADTDQVRAFRQAAAARFEQAVKAIDRATEPSDLSRAKTQLDAAAKDCQQARRYLDRVTGGTAKIAGDDAVRPAEQAPDPEDPSAVPEKERGVSFFSSKPAPISRLVPVTINVDGVDRQVLATPSEAAEIAKGQIPAVRSFQVNGRVVPWYMYDGYDPYRDYWQYQRSGWSDLAAGAVAGFIGAELIDSLFSRPAYAGSWISPYGYAPGWDSWGHWDLYDRDYFDSESLRAHQYAFSDPYTNPAQAGGAGFAGDGYDQSDYGNDGGQAGGAGFFGGDNS